MSTSSNISQSVSEPGTPQTTHSRIQNYDQSLSHVDLGHSLEQSVKSAQKEIHQKRIQSLRKELDYLKSTEWQFENQFSKNNNEQDDDAKEDYLAEQLLQLDQEMDEDKQSRSTPQPLEIPKNATCFQRTGVITYMSDDNYVLIDGMLYFDMSACSINLNINDQVLYLGYKDANDSIIVTRILQNQGICWADGEEAEEVSFEVIDHTIIGEVEYRGDRFVYMKESDLKFNLDDVEGTLIPVQGDWLELKCRVQFDEAKPTDISAAQVIEVISIRPLRHKVKHAAVTAWSGEDGVCDKLMFFNRQALQNGVDPVVGSKVVVEAIESNQGTYAWRVIKLIVIESPVSEIKTNTADNEEDTLTLERQKNIEVTHPLQFHKVDIDDTAIIFLDVTNNSTEVFILNKWVILSSRRESQVNVAPYINRPIKVLPLMTFTLKIQCCPKVLGPTKECLVLVFKGFQIKRFIEIDIVDKNVTSNCAPNFKNIKFKPETEKLESLRQIRKNGERNFVPGERLVKPPAFVPVRLGIFPIPDKIWSVVLGESEQTEYFQNILDRLEANFPCLIQELNIHNYTDKWHTLVYMDEVQANVNMRVYDMPKAFLVHCQEYLSLEIKGLSERRPSLIKGDRVIVKDIWDSDAPDYEGYIHGIRNDVILMKFNNQFHETYSGSDVSVEFHFNRGTYRRSHQAINLAICNLGPDILLPCRVSPREKQVPQEHLQNVKWFNEILNSGQKAAVTNILLGTCRPLPYCIYGPPGTGKTVTVVEAILQILTFIPDSRILVATPSNSAANLITERLVQYRNVFSDSIVRLIAHHLVDSDSIPDIIKPYCATLDIGTEEAVRSRHTVKHGMNLNCQKTFVGRHRVTIGTCQCIGTLSQIGLPRGHFTHIIVDEAGQATEPEILIPMTFVDKDSGQIVLAGDPMQLGPVIISKYCRQYGMSESYLSRILERFPYQRDYDAFPDGFDNRLVTKLNENYRSIENVLSLPSAMFYNSSLVPKIHPNLPWISRLLEVASEIFDAPIENAGGTYVYGIRGTNLRAEDSPSWYNPHEASMLAITTCKLYKKDVTPDEIGIIAPYIAQIKHIRLLFESMGLPEPKIGTVEEFQGQERQIILISTVRSSASYLAEDQRHTLGFVKNPKRLNVALTRAQVAIFLFCDPYILCKDRLWGQVVMKAVQEEKYMGCDLPNRSYNEEAYNDMETSET